MQDGTIRYMQKLFSAIAGKYDRMNRIMTLGLDLHWRRAALGGIELPPHASALDLACGTGDFSIEALRRWPSVSVTGVDITPEMLDAARSKLPKGENMKFMVGDAQNLHALHDQSFQLIMCAFGFRNFPDKAKALRECHRLLADGGRLVVLELFRPASRIAGAAVNAWIAAIARMFARGSEEEYAYLRHSVANTLSASAFSAIAGEAGFRECYRQFLLPSATCLVFEKV